MGTKQSFEKGLEELEKIVEELENGTLTLDEALKRYERGVAAHKQCREVLAAAEKRIELLLRTAEGKLETEPLGTDGAAEADSEASSGDDG